MRTLLSAVCAATLVAASVSAQNARPTDLVGRTFQAHVVGVIDGDTMEVVRVNTKRHIRIRLDAIDSPETGEPFSQEARSMARVTVFDKVVEIVGKDVDRYGRLVARIQTNGKDLSTEIVSAGLACHFLRHSSDATLTWPRRGPAPWDWASGLSDRRNLDARRSTRRRAWRRYRRQFSGTSPAASTTRPPAGTRVARTALKSFRAVQPLRLRDTDRPRIASNN